ncbi:Hypothetical Protein XCAW_04310 [Xanthomonas citri subsp. citri Aw12879]|nr:Hypothetical Protein XCAW_04310 [Xanthomonas citri subsp. citri Aw12879]
MRNGSPTNSSVSLQVRRRLPTMAVLETSRYGSPNDG